MYKLNPPIGMIGLQVSGTIKACPQPPIVGKLAPPCFEVPHHEVLGLLGAGWKVLNSAEQDRFKAESRKREALVAEQARRAVLEAEQAKRKVQEAEQVAFETRRKALESKPVKVALQKETES